MLDLDIKYCGHCRQWLLLLGATPDMIAAHNHMPVDEYIPLPREDQYFDTVEKDAWERGLMGL